MRFLEYEMHNSNECKRNFVAIYDGSSSVEHLKNKFCSTVANDVMLVSSVGVVRLWADEGSRKSKFRILFTTFHEREWISCQFRRPASRPAWLVPFCFSAPCEKETFFCHSNMCINHTLVCNGIQNCVYPWDENHCKGRLHLTHLYRLCLNMKSWFFFHVVSVTREEESEHPGHAGPH